MSNEIQNLPRLISQAAAALAKATTAAEVLDARDKATLAYDTAKLAAHFAKIKKAHDSVIEACRRAQGDALVIEVAAQCRLADEYDAAQGRGEVAKRSDGTAMRDHIPGKNKVATVTDIGLTSKQVHEARAVRDAEKKTPGVIRKTVDAKLEAGGEPTRADVKRAAKPKSGNTAAKPKGGPQPQRRKNAVDTERQAATLVLDKGLSYEAAATEVGLKGSVQVVKTAVAREEGRREPQVTRDDLSLTAQQKFDTALRKHQEKLDASFHENVNARVNTWLRDTILPQHRQEQALAKKIVSARRGVMDKQIFNKIRRALHPDSRLSISEKLLAEAFEAFMALEKLLLNESDSPTIFGAIPNTIAEWDAMRAKASAQRRAQRNPGMVPVRSAHG